MLSHHLQVAINAAQAAGQVLEQHFRQIDALDFSDKGSGDIVSAADFEAESVIMRLLQERFPTYTVYSEETRVTVAHDAFVWVIDPLDGTNNFAIGSPQFSTSIALIYNSEPILGVIYNPISRQLVWAEKGAGVFNNHVALRRKCRKPQQKLTVALDVPYGGDEIALKMINGLTGRVKRILTQWSPALDYVAVATGRIDAVICLGAEVEDKMAGLCIAKEAGCPIKEIDSKFNLIPYAFGPWSEYTPKLVIPANTRVMGELMELLTSCI